jgi:hypothetical protein
LSSVNPQYKTFPEYSNINLPIFYRVFHGTSL